MMRQMGGSFGIPRVHQQRSWTTRTAAHRLDLVSRLSIGDPATDGRLSQLTHLMASRGATLGRRRTARSGSWTRSFRCSRTPQLSRRLPFVGILSIVCIPSYSSPAARAGSPRMRRPQRQGALTRTRYRPAMKTHRSPSLALAAMGPPPGAVPAGPLTLSQTIEAVHRALPSIDAAQAAVDAARARTVQANASACRR